MSTFGTGSTTTAGASITLRNFTGTNGVQAGSDGLVPGPNIGQSGYVLGAGGDWTLEILGGIPLADSSDRIATTQFVQQVIGNAQLGGNANLAALGDVNLNGLIDNQFLQYNLGAGEWQPITLSLGSISDVNLAGLADGNTIVWDANANEWVVGVGGGGGGGAADLDDLNDVSILNPIAGHFLVHNGAGNFVNRLISTADLSDSANIALLNVAQTFSGDVIFTADVDLTGAVTDVVTQGAGNNSTLAASTAFVQQEINALNLGTASQSNVGDFLASNAGINDLSDVNTNGVANGNVLTYDNGTWTPTAPAVTYTDEEARNASGTALANGVHTGVSFVNDDANDRINATVSLGAFSINDLSDVDTTNKADGKILKFDVNGHLVVGDDTGKTQEEIEDIVGAMVSGNTETDITVTYDDNAGKLNFIVDNTIARLNNPALTGVPTAPTANQGTNTTQLATTQYVQTEITTLNLGTASQKNVGVLQGNVVELGANGLPAISGENLTALGSISTLSDVNTAGVQNGQVLKWDGASFVPGNEGGNTQEEIEDIVGTMFTANNAGNTHITFSYDDTEGANDGTITAVVTLASTDLTDTANISLLNANQTLTGNKTFTGEIDLTGATATAFTQNASDNSTSLATTAYVDNQIDVDIQALDLANNYQALNARLSDISGLAPTANNFIVGDGNNFTLETPTDVITSLGMGVAQHDLLIGSGANTFTTIATTAGSRSFLASNAGLDDLADVTLGGVVLAEGQVLRVSNDNTTLVNAVLSFGDLSDTGNVVQTDAGAIFGAFAYNFTGATSISVPAPTQNAHASTKLYVDTQVATAQPLDATLTGLANLAVADGDLLLGNGADTFEKVSLSAGVETYLRSSGGVGDLNDVTLGDVALGNGQTLRYENGAWKNLQLDLSDLTGTGSLVKTDTGAIFGAFNYDFSASTSVSVPVPTQNAHASTKLYVDTEVANKQPLDATLTALSDLVIADGDLLFGSGADTFEKISTTAGVETYLKSAGGIGNLADVTLDGNQVANHFLVHNGVNGFVNQTISTSNLSDSADITLTNRATTFGAFAYNFEASTLTAKNPILASDDNTVATTSWVNDVMQAAGNVANLNDLTDVTLGGVAKAEGQVLRLSADNQTFVNAVLSYNDLADKPNIQNADATLTALAGLATQANELIYSTGVDQFAMTTFTANARTFVGSDATLNDLSNVLTANLADAQILVYDSDGGADDNQWKNVSLSGDITISNLGVSTIASQVVTNDKIATPFVNLTDGANTDKLNLGETITFSGTANEIEVVTSNDVAGNVAGATITIGLPNDVTIGNDLTVTGNLTVNGTTTTIDTTNLDIEDQIIRLNKGVVAGANINDIGLFLERGTTGNDAVFFWDESSDKFKLGTTTEAHTVASFDDAQLTLATLNLDKVETATIDATGLASLDGGVNVNDLTTISSQDGTITIFNGANPSIRIAKDNDDVLITSFGGNIYFDDAKLWTTGTLSAGSTSLSSLVVNDLGEAVDFRVEGDNQTHLLFTDGTNDRVGINTANPDTQFHVNGDTKLVGGLSHSEGAVAFNTGLGNFDFRVAGDNQANLLFVDASSDRIGIHTNTPSKTLDVVGDVGISSTLAVTGKATLSGSLDLTTGSTTGITFRSEIADGGIDADQTLLRVNIGGVGPLYRSISWIAADDLFNIEGAVKVEGDFIVGAVPGAFSVNSANGDTSVAGSLSVGGATTFNNVGGTSDLIVQNNGVDVLNVDVSAGTTTITGQLLTDDLRAKTAGSGSFKIKLQDNVEDALTIEESTNGLDFIVFDTRDNQEIINLVQDTTFKGEVRLQNANTNGIFFNSNRADFVSEDATLLTIEGGTNKNDVVLAWDTSDNALNLNGSASLHLQGINGGNALTIGGALEANSTIVMTTAGAITLNGTLESPTLNTDKITDRTSDGIEIELADAVPSALVIRQGGAGEPYLTINTNAQTITLNEDTTFDATVSITGDTTLDASLKIKYIDGLTTPLILANSDRTGNGSEADAILIEVERGLLANAKIKWDETSKSFEFDKLLSAEANFQVGTDAQAPKATINSTTGDLSTTGTISSTGAITTDATLNFTSASQGAIVFNSDLGVGDAPDINDDFGLTVNRGNATDAKVYWDEGDDAWYITEGKLSVEKTLEVDTGNAGSLTFASGSITSANNAIDFGVADLSTGGSITSVNPADAEDSTVVATTAWVRDRKLGDLDQVDTSGFNANDQILVWDQDNGTFKADTLAAISYSKEQAIDDVGKALSDGTGGNTGADTIEFTVDDANDIINLALGISSGNLTDISNVAPTDTQVLRWVNANNQYEPTTLGTAADLDVGLNSGEIATLSDHYYSNTNETADLIITGRFVEAINFGLVTEAFDANTDFALDYQGEGLNDPVIYSAEDYGVLVV